MAKDEGELAAMCERKTWGFQKVSRLAYQEEEKTWKRTKGVTNTNTLALPINKML